MNTAPVCPQPSPEQATASILLVEDDILQRIVLAEWLRSLHYVVHEAASTDEASRILASPLIRTDLVVTDIGLPGMIDGLDLKNYIRRAFPAMPVIVVSGNARPEGLDDPKNFFPKPFGFEAISSRIAELLMKKGS